jgi:uncharacterized protein YbaP (TraB family)
MKRLLAALVATTLFAGSALAQTASPAAPTALVPKLMANPALWVVKDKDTTIYLLGTVHVLKPGTIWLDGGVKKAYDASSEVVLELLQPDPAVMQGLLGKYAVDPDGPALTAKMSPDVKALYEKTMTELGLPAPAFEKFQPWFVSTIVSLTAMTKAGYDRESGVEQQITVAATRDGKKLAGLETAEQQLGFFASLPEAAQLAFLKSTLEELQKINGVFDTMIADWARGDPEALARLLNESMNDSPELVKILLTDRNARWAQWIDDRMDKPGTIFIAVGAGHLAGSNSVQNMLKARKLNAVRIPS